MTTITAKEIKKEMSTTRMIVVGFGCLIVALLFIVLPLLKVDVNNPNYKFNFIVGAIALVVLIGIPLGWIFGIRFIIKGIKTNKIIDQQQYRIEVDTVQSLYFVGTGDKGDDSGIRYAYSFENYTKRTNRNISFLQKEGEKVKVGDQYYMLYDLKKDKYMACFPVAKFVPDESIRIEESYE